MSHERVKENLHFFWLLLHADHRQRVALLKTATPSQVNFLSELFYNLLHTLPLSEAERKPLRKRRFLKGVANIKLGVRARKAKIVAHHNQVIHVLDEYSGKLQGVIDAVQPSLQAPPQHG